MSSCPPEMAISVFYRKFMAPLLLPQTSLFRTVSSLGVPTNNICLILLSVTYKFICIEGIICYEIWSSFATAILP